MPIIGLLTDFGNDFAVAALKGVILQETPSATIIDIDHTIDKFNIASAGFVLRHSIPYFPRGTIFVYIVDPGVGTARRPLYVQAGDYHFVGPDNGTLSQVLGVLPLVRTCTLDTAAFAPHSNTFHGRDLFAPAAARIARGDLSCVRESTTPPQRANTDGIYAWYIDSFGNIKTSLTLDAQAYHTDFCHLTTNTQHARIPFVHTFAQVESGQLLCYQGSNRTLEIAVNQSSAAQLLGIRVGDPITITWCRRSQGECTWCR